MTDLERILQSPELTDTAKKRAEEKASTVYPPSTRLPYLGSFSNDDVPYDITDYKETRKRLMNNVLSSVEQRFPLESDKYVLSLDNLHYKDPDVTPRMEKDALLKGKTLGTQLKGDWVLYDKASGKEIERKQNNTLVNLPYLTDRGVFIRSGNEYGLRNMFRLKPGLYTRIKEDGIIATHINPAQGTGQQCNLLMNPENGVFTIKMGTRHYGVLPLLLDSGKSEDDIRKAWGDELYDVNFNKYSGIITGRDKKGADEYSELWNDKLSKYELDDHTTKATLGTPYSKLTGNAMVDVTKKIIHVAQTYDDAETDDRESLRFQNILGSADYIPERITRDGGGLFRKLLTRVEKDGNLSAVQSGAFQPHVDSVFQEDRHAGYIDGASPIEALDFAASVSRIGAGGIGIERAAPSEDRGIHNSYLGFIDPIRSPESQMVGLQVYMTHGVRKDSKGNLWTRMIPAGENKPRYVDMVTASESTVATPEYFNPDGDPEEFIPAFRQGKKLEYVPRKDVDFFVADTSNMMSDNTGFIGGIGGIRSNRTMLGSKASSQALSLPSREAPLVARYLKDDDGNDSTTEAFMGKRLGSRYATEKGRVISVSDDEIAYRGEDGKKHTVSLYNNLPANNKGWLTNTPVVKEGDMIEPGKLLAYSNYTDKDGKAALGVNLRVAMITGPESGTAFDAITVSESAAKNKLASEQLYKTKAPINYGMTYDKDKFLRADALHEFNNDQMSVIGDDGVVVPGTVLHKGDPMIVGVNTKDPGIRGISRKALLPFVQRWEHDYPGTVIDVGSSNKAVTVYTKALTPAREGDKISTVYGNKGVIGKILPDDQMLKDANGIPFEVYQSPLGLPSRVNSMVLGNLQLGKVAKKIGKQVVWKDFNDQPMNKAVLKMLEDNGLKESEDLQDPVSGKIIPDIDTGYLYYLKFKHTGDSKEKSRGTGRYTMEGLPLKGGHESARRFGSMEIGAVYGNTGINSETIKDAKLVRGQQNDEFWRSVMNGDAPPNPGIPLVHKKFFAHLQAAGVNLEDRGDRIHMFSASNDDVHKLTGNREVVTGGTYDAKDLRPMSGGLFDPKTFGERGDQWGYYALPEPMLNPLMEKSVASILGWKDKELQGVLDGEMSVEGKTGQSAVKEILDGIDINKEFDRVKYQLKSERLPALKRDKLLKKYRAIGSLIQEDKKPSDMFLDRVPILPPLYRPVSIMDNDVGIVSDSNYMYKSMIDAAEDFNEAKSKLPDEMMLDARKNLHHAVSAAIGLEDSPDRKLQEKNIEGVLKWAFGKGSPKFGSLHRKVYGATVDTGGLGVAAADSRLGLDEMGIPEQSAWNAFRPFVIRNLRRNGFSMSDAMKMAEDEDPRARVALQEELKKRPVMLNRAPTLHKYNVAAFWPRITPGNILRYNPIVAKGYNADADGDTMSFHVPVSAAAVKEAEEKMLPSKNLFSPQTLKARLLPVEEFAQGLYFASRMSKGEPAVFNTKAEMKRALNNGLIKYDTPVRIREFEKASTGA